jgi:hypothetical protein
MEEFVIMAIVLVEVALWQWRVAITLRHSALGGALLGFIGAIVPITAISRVVQDMGNIAKIAGYAIDQRRTAELEREIHALAPEACWTVERIAASRGLLAALPT